MTTKFTSVTSTKKTEKISKDMNSCNFYQSKNILRNSLPDSHFFFWPRSGGRLGLWIRIALSGLDNHDPTPGFERGVSLNKIGFV